MDNFISVDLEEWYHFGFASTGVEKKRKSLGKARIIENTLNLLSIFDSFNINATFFILGVIAQEFPDLIKEIEKKGHEIASHGYSHIPLYKLTKEEFDMDIKKSLKILSKIVKQRILGYRAPYFSITDSPWVYDILAENGFLYDSSLKNCLCSKAGQKREAYFSEIHTSNHKVILEFPVSSIRIIKWDIPFSGGTCFRMMPLSFLKFAVDSLNRKKEAVNMYLHPRDIDTLLPKVRLSCLNQIRYSGRFGSTETKIRGLLERFKFISVRDFLVKKHII